MTDITYDKVAAAAPASAATERTAQKGFWQRFLEAMVEARMHQAERIARNGHFSIY